MIPLKMAWVGFHIEGLPALEALLAAGAPIRAVLTLSEDVAAQRSGGGDYAPICRRFGLPLYRVANINDPQAVDILRSLSPDLVFVIGWPQIVRPAALRTARIGMIGAHASLLPHNRGSAPINWALIRREAQTGNTLIWLDENLDSGDIIDQVAIPITAYDTCATLYLRVAETNRDMLLRLLPRLLEGERPGRPQPASDEPLLPRRRPADGRIDWRQAAGAVYDFIRALTRPYPGAFSDLAGRRWRIWSAALLPLDAQPGMAGEVLGPVRSPVDQACGQLVACGYGALAVTELERDDGSPLLGPALAEQPWTGLRFSDALQEQVARR